MTMTPERWREHPDARDLLVRYAQRQQAVLVRYFNVLRWTRKTGRIADSVIVKQLQYFARFPAELVVRACLIHLERYAHKREAYTRGILRGLQQEKEVKPHVQAGKAEGRPGRGGYGQGRYGDRAVDDLPF